MVFYQGLLPFAFLQEATTNLPNQSFLSPQTWAPSVNKDGRIEKDRHKQETKKWTLHSQKLPIHLSKFFLLVFHLILSHIERCLSESLFFLRVWKIAILKQLALGLWYPRSDFRSLLHTQVHLATLLSLYPPGREWHVHGMVNCQGFKSVQLWGWEKGDIAEEEGRDQRPS